MFRRHDNSGRGSMLRLVEGGFPKRAIIEAERDMEYRETRNPRLKKWHKLGLFAGGLGWIRRRRE